MASKYMRHHEEARTSLVARLANEGIATSFHAAERHGGGCWSTQIVPHNTPVGQARLFTVYLHTDGNERVYASVIAHRVTEVGDHDHAISLRSIVSDWTHRANQASIGLDHPLVVQPVSVIDHRVSDVLRECGWTDPDYSDGQWSAGSPCGTWFIEARITDSGTVDATVYETGIPGGRPNRIEGIDHLPAVGDVRDGSLGAAAAAGTYTLIFEDEVSA